MTTTRHSEPVNGGNVDSRPPHIRAMLQNITRAMLEHWTHGILDSATGAWITVDPTLTIAEADLPCDPGNPMYILVSDLAPDMPIIFGPESHKEKMIATAALLADTGMMGRCQFCQEPVVNGEGFSLVSPSPEESCSRRYIAHLACAQTVGRAVRTGLLGH